MLDRYLVTARSFDEYRAMFALSDRDLAGPILDCGAGASSFAAGAPSRVVRADPLYATNSHTALVDTARADLADAASHTLRKADRYVWRWFRDFDDYVTSRRASIERFAAAGPSGCVAGALPALPFAGGSFTIALVSHLLFVYGDRLDVDFHVAALTDLVRVAAQVRVFPLVVHDGTTYRHLDEIRRRLSAETEIRDVDYEFQRGGTQMLVCR